MSAFSGTQKAAATRSPFLRLISVFPALVSRTSSRASCLTTPLAVTNMRCSLPSATTVCSVSPRLAPKICAALAPRARPVASESSAAFTCRARPSEVTAVTVEVVRAKMAAVKISWRPGLAWRAPSTEVRPICPEVDKVTAQGSSATFSASSVASKTGTSSGWIISVRRGRPKRFTASWSSVRTKVR